MPEDKAVASSAYARGLLLSAYETLTEHPDPEVRRRALDKVHAWSMVLAGMQSGTLEIGSRTPVSDTPAWATLEVMHGGFATGRLLAEEPPDAQEQALLSTLSPPEPGETARGRLNRHALSPEGQAQLLDLLHSGLYRVRLPEHAALPLVAWLSAHGAAEAALTVVEAIAPFFNRLRFTPEPAATPMAAGVSVSRLSAREVQEGLKARQAQPQVARMNETLRVWHPLTDRVVALLLATVEGEAPRLATDEQGALLRRPDGQPQVLGGWPLKVRPANWDNLARQWLGDLDLARSMHTLCVRPVSPKHLLGRFAKIVRQTVSSPAPLHKKTLGELRGALADFLHAHGAPGSERLARVREEQARIAAYPSLRELSALLAQRLEPYLRVGAIPNLDIATRPVDLDESESIPAGWQIPEPLVQKLLLCLEAPVEELVARGVVPSGEVLADLLPQITAHTSSAAIADPVLRRVYSATTGAFRARRSLLLLNLEHQVRLEELPWVAALAPFRQQDESTQNAARQTLQQVSALALSAFPQTQLPNPLVQEMSSLAEAMGGGLTLVEELAADIFMGTFTPKFQTSAHQTWALLKGSLYARYFSLTQPPPEPPEEKAGSKASRQGRATAEAFATLCRARACEAGCTDGWSVASNGAVLEQCQILTTHNLAQLYQGLDLHSLLGGSLVELAQGCWTWILRRNSQTVEDWRARLQLAKNCAYAWRQMLFFLSMAGPEAERPFVVWARAQLIQTKGGGPLKLEPVLKGLERVVAGESFDAEGKIAGGGRRFLGWSVGRHWVLEG